MHLNIPYWKGILKRVMKNSLFTLAYFVIAIAILSSIFRALTPLAVRYQPQLEQMLTKATGQAVQIKTIQTGWYWFQPVLKANQVTIGAQEKNAIIIHQIQLGVSLLGSLIHWRIQPGLLLIDGITLHIEEIDKGWKIQNITMATKELSQDNEFLHELFVFILGHQSLQLKNVQLDLKLKDQPVLALRQLNAILVNSLGQQRLRGQVFLEGMSPKPIDFGAELVLNPIKPDKIIGHLYLGLDEFNLTPWLKQLAFPQIKIAQGTLKARIWGDVIQGRLNTLQTTFQLTDLAWKFNNASKSTRFKKVEGSLAWTKTLVGWRVLGSQIKIEDKHSLWPSTDFALDINGVNQDFDLAVTNIDLQSVFGLTLPLPENYKWLNNAHPKGELSDLHIVRQHGQYKLSTQFKEVSTKEIYSIQSIDHVSGMLNWGPTGGRLGLLSHNLKAKFKGYDKLYFSMVNMDLSWHQLGSSWTVDLSSLALDNPHLKLNGQGKLENVTATYPGLADFKFEFALHSGEYWLKFLPKKSIKPKLYTWLTQDLLKINKALGLAKLQGDLNAFPFDNGGGIFHIEAEMEGVKLNFAHNWPTARNINARLQVDKRELSAQIAHASIGSVATGPINLSIDQLGLDKERLLVHGLAQGESAQAWPMILASPLGKKNAFLSYLHWEGPLSLDLQLDVPLFPEDDEILILGKVDLLSDQLLLQTPVIKLPFEKIKGTLNFDHHGLLSSQLNTQLWGQMTPVDIIASLSPQRMVTMNINSIANVKDVFDTFQQSPIDGLSGQFALSASLIQTTGLNSKNTLVIKSDLKGLKIDFPPFIQKKKIDKTPFEATVNFTSMGQFNADMHYSDKIQIHHSEQGIWSLKSTLPALSGELAYNSHMNLLSGEIQSVIIPDNLESKVSSKTWQGKPSDLPQIELKIAKLQYGDLLLGSFFMAAKTEKNSWHIDPWIIESPAYIVRGSAEWQKINGQHQSQVNLDFETKDIHQALLQWQTSPVLEKGKGVAHAQLHWQDVLWRGKKDKMAGELIIKITEGRTMNFNKQTESKLGLVKLLNLLSLQTIPRRLKLDFSDLSQDGYSFDEFDGHFILQEGILRTESCSIEGPVAAAEITGSIDIMQKLYNLSIRISPHIAASLPLVAVIAGGPVAGPIAGVATWVATKIINRGFQKIVAYTYKVTGPWKDPLIEPVKLYRASDPQGYKMMQKGSQS